MNKKHKEYALNNSLWFISPGMHDDAGKCISWLLNSPVDSKQASENLGQIMAEFHDKAIATAAAKALNVSARLNRMIT